MLSLDRPLHMTGDWGMANFYRIMGWIAHSLYARHGRQGLCTISTSQAWMDAVGDLGAGRTDITIATPSGFARQAIAGVGPFKGQPLANIRALGLLPHDDAILFAVPEESPIHRFEDIVELRYPLRLAIAPNDGYCYTGWASAAILSEYGITEESVLEWGGEYIYREFPRFAPPLVSEGHANAVINEAMMLPEWRLLAESRPMRFLSIDEDVLSRLHTKYDMDVRTVHAGRFPGQADPIRTIDFSGWLVVATDTLPDDVAEAVTSVLVEERSGLERLYSHWPLEISPLHYPIRPDHLPQTNGVPLHPAAERYFAQRGLL